MCQRTVEMSTFSFSVDSMMRGYHEYMYIWENPSVEYNLVCEREPGNAHDTHAVAIKKNIDGEIKIVGHILRKISAVCSIFLRHGGNILCHVSRVCQYSLDLAQGGLEITCVLKFVASNQKEATKTKCLLESALLNIEGESIIVTVSHANIDIPQISGSTADDINNDTTLINGERVEKAEDDVMEEIVHLTESCNIDSPPAKKQKRFDAEKVILGEELADSEINCSMST